MRKVFLLLLLLINLPLGAAEKETFFARVIPDRQEIYAGDSMLVSIVVYSEAPIEKAECLTNFSVKEKCTMRKLDINRDATVSRVREGNHVYYTLVWSQYVFAPREAGNYTIPVQKFKASLRKVISMPDMFDQMMGARPEYKTVKVQGESKALTIRVVERPLRTTQEMMRSGSGVI